MMFLKSFSNKGDHFTKAKKCAVNASFYNKTKG